MTSPNNTTLYESVPLPLGSKIIRLLRILNGNSVDDMEPISCELHLASLDRPYVALS